MTIGGVKDGGQVCVHEETSVEDWAVSLRVPVGRVGCGNRDGEEGGEEGEGEDLGKGCAEVHRMIMYLI